MAEHEYHELVRHYRQMGAAIREASRAIEAQRQVSAADRGNTAPETTLGSPQRMGRDCRVGDGDSASTFAASTKGKTPRG